MMHLPMLERCRTCRKRDNQAGKARRRRLLFESLEARTLLTLPGPPGTPDLHVSDDTGYSHTDDYTAETEHLRILWSAGSDATRYYYAWDNAAPQSAYTTALGAIVAAPSSQGWHWFYVRSWNVDGFSDYSRLKIFIERQVPVLSGLDLRDSDDTGYNNADNITQDVNVRFSWSVDTNGGSGIQRFRYGFNPSDLSSSTTFTYADVHPPLNNGAMTFYVVAESKAGLTSQPIQLPVWFDNNAPTASPPSWPTGEITGTSPTISWDYDPARDWKFDVDIESRSDPTAAWTDVNGWPRTVVREGNVATANLSRDTDYQVRLRKYDLAGNVSSYSDWAAFRVTTPSGPRVTTMAPPSGSELGPVDHIVVRFDKQINGNTFTTSDVSISRSGTVIPVTSVERIGPTAFSVHFPSQTAVGTYQVVIGPDIKSLTDDFPMNQNQRAPNGENPGDRFDGTFPIGSAFVSGPRVVSLAPDISTVDGSVSSVRVTFDKEIATSSFDATDATISRSGNAIAVDSVERRSTTEFRLHFAQQTVPGTYSVVIGPGITDLGDRPMNQDLAEPNGQNPEDRFTGTFRIADPDTTAPVVTLVSPHSGVFQVGQTITIEGTASDANGISHVQVELYKGGTALSQQIGIISPGVEGEGNRTSVTWQIPTTLPTPNGRQLNGDDYKIKWVAWDNSPNHNHAAGYSSGCLTIRPDSSAMPPFIAPWERNDFNYYSGRSFFYDQDHLGADIALAEGTRIRAGVAGRLVYYGSAPGYGNLVVAIEMDFGQTRSFVNAYGQTVETSKALWILGHLRRSSERDGAGTVLGWQYGDLVGPNDPIGYIEQDAENGAGAEHLHIGLRLQSETEAQAADAGKWLRGYEQNSDGSDSGMGIHFADPVVALGLNAGTPAAPSGLTAYAKYADTFFVDWANVSNAGDYRLFRSVSPNGSWTQIYLGPNSQYTDSNVPTPHLVPGQDYYYHVVATNAAGDSAPSDIYGPIRLPTTSPGVPRNVRATPSADSLAISTTWESVSGASRYIVERSFARDDGYLPIGDTAGDTRSYLDADVRVGIGHYYRVRAVVDGIVSAASDPSTATIIQVQTRPAAPEPAPTLNRSSYDGVAKVFLWKWGAAPGKEWEQKDPGLPGAIDWSRRTIILTHGWNDRLDQGDAEEYMEIFAKRFAYGRTAEALAQFNVLAVDWWNGGQPGGSDPNGRGLAYDLAAGIAIDVATGLPLDDANLSAANGIAAAVPLARAFLRSGIQPGKVMLVGHSNGAGFMANLAATIYAGTGLSEKIDELVALDAPLETLSYWATMAAAPVVNRVSNYFQPLAKMTIDSTWESCPVHLDFSLSFGAAMFPLAGNVTNYALSTLVSDRFLPDEKGHTQVPLRYAWTADNLLLHQEPWGFQMSGFIQGGDSTPSNLLVTEDVPYYYDTQGGTFNVTIGPLSAVAAGVMEKIRAFTAGVRNAFVQTAKSIWDAGVRVEQSLQDVLKGLNSSLVIPDPSIFGGGSTGGGGAGGSWEVVGEAHSPAYAAIDVRIPGSASILSLNLAVADFGNMDTLQVAIGDQIVGEVNLATHASAGNAPVDLWIAEYAGQTVPLRFLLPSEDPSSAKFTLSNIQFVTLSSGVAEDSPLHPGLYGNVFRDLDGDGRRDEGEAGLAGEVVFVDGNGDGDRDDGEPWATTDANGDYRIVGLPAGNYTVRHELQPGWTQTLPAVGVQSLTGTGESVYGDVYRTDGATVVWDSRYSKPTTQVLAYAGGQVKEVSNPDVSSNANPQVDHGQIVWHDPVRGEIYYDDGQKTRKFSLPDVYFNEPQISDGQLVWSGNGNFGGRSNFEIFFYRGHGDSFDQITTNSEDDFNPQIDHGQIVWRRGMTDSQIIYYDTATGQERQIDTGSQDNSPPLISGGRVVWVGNDGNDDEIYSFDGTATVNLSNNPVKDDSPDVRDGRVVWRSFVGPETELFLFDGTVQQITSDGRFKLWPHVSGSRVVWEGNDGSDSEIYLYDAGTVTQLTDNSLPDTWPRLMGNQVIWGGDDGHDRKLCLATLVDAYQLSFNPDSATTNVNFGVLQPYLTLDIAEDVVAENAGSRSATAVVTRHLSDPSQPLTVTLASLDPDNVTVPATATILAGQTSASLSLEVVNDDIWEPRNSYTVTASADGFASGSDLLTVEDAAASLWEDGQIALQLDGPLAPAAPLTVTITTLPTAGQLFQTEDGSSRGTAITEAGTVVTDSLRRVIFVPDPDGTGSPYASFGFQAGDGQDESVEGTFSIAVDPVNDVPMFSTGGDQLAYDDGAARTVVGWATSISPGASNESSQALTFLVSNDNAGLFVVPPAIAPSGTLTYTTAQNVGGTATVTVQLKDNAGTDRGGVDTSAAQTFTITVQRMSASARLYGRFGAEGKVLTEFGANDVARDIIFQPDGKLLAVGSTADDVAIARYLADGSLDTSFGLGGRVTADFGLGTYGVANGVALQPDGKIIVGGGAGLYGASPNESWFLARYDASGNLDASFGSGGKVLADFGSTYETAYDVVVQPDGRIVATGYAGAAPGHYDFVVARFNVDGSLDDGTASDSTPGDQFGSGGKVVTGISTTDVTWAVALQSDGKIVAAGRTGILLESNDVALVRYNVDGSLDAGFGSAGIVSTDLGGNQEGISSLAIQSDGKLVVGGNTNRGGSNQFVVARYDGNGRLDASFGSSGSVTIDLVTPVYGVRGLAIQANGKIIAAGTTTSGAGGTNFGVARLNSDGSLDDGSPADSTPGDRFGTAGKAVTDFAGADDEALSVALQSDGSIVAAGSATVDGRLDFALARYAGDAMAIGGNTVWHDLDGDGLQDAGEPGVAGAVVEVFSSNDDVAGNADDVSRNISITDANGQFSLGSLTPETKYYLVFRTPVGDGSGYIFSPQDAGVPNDDMLDSDANASGVTAMFTLSSGENFLHLDAGLVGSAPGFGFALGAGAEATEGPWDVVTDEAGNVYVTGYYQGTVDFDPGPGVYNITSAGGNDIFVAKYTASGALVWARSMGGSGNLDYGYGMVVTADGSIFVTGLFSAEADFDPGPATFPLVATGGTYNGFLAKLDASGGLVWVRAIVSNGDGYGFGISQDATGDFYITGIYLGTCDFDPGTGTQLLTSEGTEDVFVTKLDSAGNLVWARSIGGTGLDRVGGAPGIGPDGSVYIAGTLGDTFVLKLTSAGDVVWERHLGGGRAHRLSIGADRAIYVTGSAAGGFGGYDVTLYKVSSSGNLIWQRTVGGSGDDQGKSIWYGPDAAVYVGGVFERSVDFDPGPGEAVLTSTGGHDVFLSKLTPAGDLVWAKNLGGTSDDYFSPVDIEVTADASVYLSGAFQGTADFDPGPDTFLVTSHGGYDAFVAKLSPVSFGDRVWNDLDADGLQDVGEPGIVGAVVEVFSSTDGVIGNADDVSRGVAITDADGRYTLAGFMDGINYYLVFRTPVGDASGYIFGPQDAGDPNDDTLDSDADASGVTAMFTLSPGQDNLSLDAGLVGSAPGFGFALRAGAGSADLGSDVATDGAGNVYVLGYYQGTTDFDAGPGAYNLTSAGGNDIFVAKYSATGALAWARSLGGSVNTDVGRRLLVASDGSVFVTGEFEGTADFDPGPGTYNLVAAGQPVNGFVAKLSSDGHLVWARVIASLGGSCGWGLAQDAAGNLYVTGAYTGTSDFDPESGAYLLTSQGGHDVFVVKLDPAGNLVWARSVGGPGGEGAYDAQIAPDGSVYVVGQFSDTADLDPGTGVYSLTSAGAFDGFVLKLTSAGNIAWARRFGGGPDDYGYGAAVSPDGAIYVTGHLSDGQDVYLCRLDSSGTVIWEKTFGGTGDDQGHAVSYGPDSAVYVGGVFQGSADFDPGADSFVLNSVGDYDVFVSKFDTAGNLVWAKSLGGASNDYANAVDLVASPEGSVYTVGSFLGTADLDPGPGTFNLTSAGGADVFVSKITQRTLGDIGDRVWNDLDGDGIQGAGEPGIPGVTVRLLDATGGQLTYTTTGGSGQYRFRDLPPGDYRVEFIAPSGFTFGPSDQGADDLRDSDADRATGRTPVFTLAAGRNNVSVDAGLYGPARIAGQVFHDLDGDGQRDQGEPGLDGWTVELVAQATGQVVSTQTSRAFDVNGDSRIHPDAERGLYSFEDLSVADYVIREVQQAASRQSYPSSGPGGEPGEHLVHLEPGVFVEQLDFGNVAEFDDGDAPAPYPTLLAGNGPSHLATGPTLGSSRDSELDGQPDVVAGGDDAVGALDDEDGVTLATLKVAQLGATAIVNVQNAPTGARLDAWIDFNGDGNWSGDEEQIADSLALTNGSHTITFDVPSKVVVGTTYARFRLSTAGGLSPTGAATDGEVEDYPVTLVSDPLPPELVTPLDDVTVAEDAADTVIDLIPAFDDPNLPYGDALTFTVTVASPVLTATLDGGQLILDYADDANGIADVRVRATDLQGLFIEDVFLVTITPVNDAPMLDNTGTMTLDAIDEDEVTNPGTLVRDILVSAGDRIADADAGALEGIAVTAVDDTHGTWQYSLDGGGNWTAFGTPEAASARLLSSDSDTYIRFVPHADWHGDVDPGVAFRAWDQTAGVNGGTADASTGGEVSAFSVEAETAAITVRDITAPVLTDLSPADEAVAVALDTNLVLTFDEEVRKGSSGSVVIRSSSDAGLVQTIDVNSPAVTVTGTTVAVDPTVTLAVLAGYYVEVTAGALEDLAGNDFPGISGATTWNFTTESLRVTSLIPIASGFAATFNAALETTVLNLYDGAEGVFGAADLEVLDGAGHVHTGALVMAEDRRCLTWIAPGNVLPPETYTVTLRSGAAAFRDVAGNTLDGDADGSSGGDFVWEFTVAATGQRVVSFADIARGAGQPVNVPAAAIGWPIRISDAQGVTSWAVDVLYNPALLNITAVVPAAGLPVDWNVALDKSTTGLAKLTAYGTTPLSGTNVEMVRLIAAVPNDAPYGASQAIRLNVLLNGGAIPVVGDVAVHKAVYLGDADGSGVHSSADAFLTVQAALGLASGFAAHSWTDPRIVGDADGSGVLSAADAFLIVQEGLELSEPFVPDNPHISVTPVGGGVDPQFWIDVNLPAGADGLVSVPVKLDIEAAASNVGALDFDLFFDPSQLTIELPGGVSAGADSAGWARSAVLVAPGQLRVGMVSSNGRPLVPGFREIAWLQFHVAATAGSAAFRRLEDDRLKPALRTVAALDIEPVDPHAGGYAWTAVDGSVAIAATNATRLERLELQTIAGETPFSAHQQDEFFCDLETELPSLEGVLSDLAGEIASVWRSTLAGR